MPASEPSTSQEAIYPGRLSIFQRLRYAVKLHLFKSIFKALFAVLNLPGVRNKSILPTFTKVYPVRPRLTNRIFIPKSYKSGDALLPLYLDIHGGGFAMGDPWVDDKFCSDFSNDNKILVVSLDYPKSPAHPWPAAVDAIPDLVNAVLEDEALPIDKSKVSIGGFSAGGNLSFAVTQFESLQGKVGGIVSYYPPVNFVTPTAVNLATRPKDAPPDPLENGVGMFNWGYINPGQDMRDPLLSVSYARREKLPPKIYIIGCELDLLCRDAEIMAENLAKTGSGDRIGTDVCWEKNGIKFEKILGELHGN